MSPLAIPMSPFVISSGARNLRRALVLFSYPFSPTRDGGSKHLANTLEFLRAFAFDVTFAALDLTSSPEQRAALEALGVHEVRADSIETHLEQFGNEYALIWISSVAAAMRHLRAIQTCAPRAKIIFETTDLQHVRLFRRAKLEQHAGWLQLALKTKQWEIAATNAAHCALVVSAPEQKLLQTACPRANVQLYMLAYPVQENTPAFAERQGIVFVGSFPHQPNQDAMKFYLDEIHPRVQTELNAPLFIVGSEPPQWLAERANENIIVTGYVPDVAPYLERAHISIAPLRFGAGVKVKIIESLSYGVPVVATTMAADGISAQHAREIWVADAPPEFAAGIVKLVRDETLWNTLARNGKNFVRENYSRAAARTRLETILRGLELL